MMGESCRDGGEFSVAAVGVPAGVAGFRAQVFVAAPTVLTHPAGVPQPGDPDPVADAELVAGIGANFDNLPDDLVSGRHMLPVYREVPLGDVQVGTAHAARAHGNQQLGWLGARHRRVDPFQRIGVHRTGATYPPRIHYRGGHRG